MVYRRHSGLVLLRERYETGSDNVVVSTVLTVNSVHMSR